MKRQKGSTPWKAPTARSTTKVTKKKEKSSAPETVNRTTKKAAENVAEGLKAVEEAISTVAEEVAGLSSSLWSGIIDEEMAWARATSWIPFWEMDAYDALYGDVLWDYDIWDLK